MEWFVSKAGLFSYELVQDHSFQVFVNSSLLVFGSRASESEADGLRGFSSKTSELAGLKNWSLFLGYLKQHPELPVVSFVNS